MINFYEAFIETTWSEKGTWYSTIDMIISLIEIGVKFSLLILFMVFYNNPIALSRDIIFSVFGCIRDVKEWFKGRKLIQKVKKFQTMKVDTGEEEVCGICLLKLDHGKKLPCGHIFHESCLM